ncbi:MAG: HAD hydrolase-like protein [Candidatus Woesearchaeota archaeon]
MDKIIVFDFSGTLIRKDIAKEASNRRFAMLGKEVDQEWLEKALATNEHYAVNNEIISKYTGIKEKERLNELSSNFFKYHMLGLANERKAEIFQEGILDVIQKLKKKDLKIAIVSGIRTDIIDGMLEIADKRSIFDFVLGQPPELGVSNEELLNKLKEKGEIIYFIGDKINDINAGKAIGGKTIFVTWGHPTGEEEKKADYMVENPEKILEIIESEKE